MKWVVPPAGHANPNPLQRDNPGASAELLDPYVRWAERTEWRGVRRLMGAALGTGGEPVPRLRVLVQAPAMSQAEFLVVLNDARWTVANV